MAQISENGRRVLERWTLLAGGIEMLIGASMAAFPDVFPGWLTILALAIAVVTCGIGFTLVWTDLTALRTMIGAKRLGFVGPVISGIGLLLIVGLSGWSLSQAPKGFLTGSSVPIVLAAAILIFSVLFLSKLTPVEKSGSETAKNPDFAAALATVNERMDNTANSIRNEISRVWDKVFALKTVHEMRRLKRDIERLVILLDRPLKEEKDRRDWTDWNARFKKFERAVHLYADLAANYYPKEAPNLTVVPPSIYRRDTGDFAPDQFPDHQTAHDFKTFRKMSDAYENLGRGMLDSIEAKA